MRRKTGGKLRTNPRKSPEKAGYSGVKKAKTRRRQPLCISEKIFIKLLIYKHLFLLRFVLDTTIPRPYYAARKF
jgi:hypothetical protein